LHAKTILALIHDYFRMSLQTSNDIIDRAYVRMYNISQMHV